MKRDGMRCVVAYANPEQQFLWNVELQDAATVQDALIAARGLAGDESIPWDAAVVGIFGTIVSRATPLHDGDRVEIYRPLAEDPKDRRRRRARHLPGSAGGG